MRRSLLVVMEECRGRNGVPVAKVGYESGVDRLPERRIREAALAMLEAEGRAQHPRLCLGAPEDWGLFRPRARTMIYDADLLPLVGRRAAVSTEVNSVFEIRRLVDLPRGYVGPRLSART